MRAEEFLKFEIFDGFSPEQLKVLLDRIKPERFDFTQNERLCTVGEKADRLWLVNTGQIQIRQELRDEATVVVRPAPCIIGEQGLIDRAGIRTASIIALESGTAFIIYRGALESAGDNVEMILIWRNLSRIVSRKLGEATNRRAQLIVQGDKSQSLLKRFVNAHALTNVSGGLSLSETYADEPVILWFSDLLGFSAVAQIASPADTAKIIRTTMEAQAEVIDAAGGYIDKFMGDGLMAYWIVRGIEEVGYREGSAKALSAAIAARKAIQSIACPPDGSPMDLRIGLHAGRAKTGNFGSERRWAFTLMGDDVNLCARLEQSKEVLEGDKLGAIRVSQNFFDCLSAEDKKIFPFRSKAKAKERTIPVFSGPDIQR